MLKLLLLGRVVDIVGHSGCVEEALRLVRLMFHVIKDELSERVTQVGITLEQARIVESSVIAIGLVVVNEIVGILYGVGRLHEGQIQTTVGPIGISHRVRLIDNLVG